MKGERGMNGISDKAAIWMINGYMYERKQESDREENKTKENNCGRF
jgi:hypothetical protein